jgi:hypothetical protein
VSDVQTGFFEGHECLAFFSRITAGQSHELANVFNTINELVGLQQDHLAIGEQQDPVDRQRLQDICGRIRTQIDRGGKIIRAVNRFAHSADVPRAVFDVRDAVHRIVYLAERWTRLKEVDLTAELPEETTAIENFPFLFQWAVFLGIEAALLAATEKKRIAVGLKVALDGVEIAVTSADPVPRSEEIDSRIAALRLVVDTLGGELRAHAGDRDGDRFIFSVPRKQHQESTDDANAEKGR